MRLFLALSCILAASFTADAQTQPPCRAVIVGVSKYDLREIEWLKYAHLDAQAFEKWVKGQGCSYVTKLDQDATLPTVQQALRNALQAAGSQENVYLFFSGRGLATPDSNPGYMLLWESNENNPKAYSLGTDELNLYIKQSRAHVFLFADLRASDMLQPRNLIEFKLKDLVPITKDPSVGRFSEILATQPGQFSEEVPEKDPKKGNGAFTLVLSRYLASAQVTTVQSLFDLLKKELPAASPHRHQSPWEFGPSNVPLRAPTRLVSRLRNPFGALLIRASYTPDREEEMADPAPEDEAVASEEEGLKVLARYGEGDQFPDDPKKLKKEDFDGAAQAFQKALGIPGLLPQQRQSIEARSLFCQGRAMLFDPNQDFRDALRVLSSSTDKRGDYPEAWNAMGIAWLEHADYANAEANFSKAIALAPNWTYPRHNLALTFVEQGDYARAEKEYREAIRRTPYQPYLYYNLGVLLHRINRKADAKAEYKLAIQWFERQSDLALDHSGQFSEEGKTDEANEFNDRSKTLLRNEAEAWNALGAIAQAEGHENDARKDYVLAASHNDRLLLANYNLGVLEAKKHPDTAIGLWKKVLAEDPKNLPAHQQLAKIYLRQGKFAESAAEYREVRQLQPENTEAKVCGQFAQEEVAATPDQRREIEKKRKKVC